MSAKTVLTEAPACPAPAAPNNAASVTTPGDAPSDFQNLLAGAVPPVAMPTPGTTQPLVQLLTLKNMQAAAKLPGAASGNAAARPGAPAVKPGEPALDTGDGAAADLLKILNDTATLLPATGDAGAEVSAESQETDEPATSDDDILSGWLDMMLPASVFAPQAGATNDAGAQTSGQGGDEAALKAAAASVIPTSLVLQAGLPERKEAADAGAQGLPATNPASNRDAATAAAQNTAAVFAAAITDNESTERDKPTNDGWMSAMSDVTGKRGPDMVPVTEARLSTPVHDTRWADALAHRLVLMARDGESVASLKLVPVDLGPLDIQITVRDGEASVHFAAAHQETRAVLEASMPRLRELLSAQGLQLSNSSVSHQSAGHGRPERSSAPGAVGAVGDETEVTSAKVISTSLLDIYA
ncbi:MAG TPA: flagellar hook-length control protein FliK [Steroidobacteraceae bacterium]|nr:flagellar hook-length control protein FliK [Steroidobacteraceae bacterium]